jgi:hypothetical protein
MNLLPSEDHRTPSCTPSTVSRASSTVSVPNFLFNSSRSSSGKLTKANFGPLGIQLLVKARHMLRKKIALEDGFPSDKMSAASQALQDAVDSFDNLSTVKDHWEKIIKPDPDYLSAANTYVRLLIIWINFQYLFSGSRCYFWYTWRYQVQSTFSFLWAL